MGYGLLRILAYLLRLLIYIFKIEMGGKHEYEGVHTD